MAEMVLVVAPHPDDESIGCGGMICLHQQRGDRVRVTVLTSGERGLPGIPDETVRSLREAEAREAGRVLGVEHLDFLRLPDLGLSANVARGGQLLADVLTEMCPSLIYLPHPQDAHPDHQATLPIVRAALAACAGSVALPCLRAYEVWSPLACCTHVEDVSRVMTRKLRAVRCYPSQLRLVRYDRAVQGLNRYRGIMAGGSRYAEAFGELSPA